MNSELASNFSSRAMRSARVIVFMLCCVGEVLAQTGPSDNSLAGTSWAGNDIFGKQLTITFGNNPRLAYKTASGIWSNGSWHVAGDSVYFELNNKFIEFTGVRIGEEMHGDGKQRRGHTGTWALRQLASTPAELAGAAGAPSSQTEASRLLSFSEIEGRFESSHDGESGQTVMGLDCVSEANCKFDTAKVSRLSNVEDLKGIVRAFDYARLNKDVVARDKSHQVVQSSLRPVLESQANLIACADLNIGGEGTSIACRLDGPLAHSTILVFYPLLNGCGDGFCGHLVVPLFRTR